MKILGPWLVWLALCPLSAGTIDASRAATILLQPGDSLVFAIPSWNYTVHAVQDGLPLNPTGVSFTLISAASTLPAIFEAGLQSSDGSFSETLAAPLSFSPGTLTSTAYFGPVSTLEGSFHLTGQASQQIFGDGEASLMLRNVGNAIVFGLPSTTLPQDLFVGLSSGPLAVGALHGTVTLQESAPAPALHGAVLAQESARETPEPPSGALLIVGGVLFCMAAWLCHTRSKNVKSIVCNPLGHSGTI